MTYPKNESEWYKLALDHLVELKALVFAFTKREINAQIFEVYLRNGEAENAYILLNKAWFMAPDRAGLHSLAGWDVLCDLCSEYGPCFYPQPAEQEA